MGKNCLGWRVNEFQVIIGVHGLSSCTTGMYIERNDKVCQKFIGFISKLTLSLSLCYEKKSFEIDLDLEGP